MLLKKTRSCSETFRALCRINKFALEKKIILTLKYLRNDFTSKLLLLQINEEFRVVNFSHRSGNRDRGVEDKAESTAVESYAESEGVRREEKKERIFGAFLLR